MTKRASFVNTETI